MLAARFNWVDIPESQWDASENTYEARHGWNQAREIEAEKQDLEDLLVIVQDDEALRQIEDQIAFLAVRYLGLEW